MAIPVNENGQLDAIVTWFELQLDDDIVLTSSPDAKSCWEQAVYHIQLGDCETTYLPNLHVFTGVLQLTFLCCSFSKLQEALIPTKREGE